MKKLFKYLLSLILILGIIAIVSTTIYNYNVKPDKTYVVNKENLIEDGSFENFNKTAGDCCNKEPNASRVYAEQSEVSIDGNYSLNLTSEKQCACINKPISTFSNSDNYLLSFHYKGDNPRFCNWVKNDNQCLPNEYVTPTQSWTKHNEFLEFTEQSISSSIYLYADSDGTRTVTNLYDDLQVRKLIPIENPSKYEYNPKEEYIFKTKADNNIHDAEMISDIDVKTGEAYFIAKGKPLVTIQFPWSEIVIIIIMLVIIVRLLFKKQVLQTEGEIKRKLIK